MDSDEIKDLSRDTTIRLSVAALLISVCSLIFNGYILGRLYGWW